MSSLPSVVSTSPLWKFKKDQVDAWVEAGGASADSSKEDVGKDSKK
jgi:hypothetical protein